MPIAWAAPMPATAAATAPAAAANAKKNNKTEHFGRSAPFSYIDMASKATVAPELEELVTVGNGIAYIFGVIGVVLFVQLIPKITKADMEAEMLKRNINIFKRRIKDIINAQIEVVDEMDDIEL